MRNNEITIVKDLSRVPQTLSFAPTALSKTFGGSAPIIQDMLLYIANKQFKNLFGEVEFSMEEFCQEFGYERTEMQRTLKEFKENPKKIPVIDGHPFDSVFEYALYKAQKENVIFARKSDEKIRLESVNIVDSIEIYYNKNSKKKTKRTYRVKLGHKVLDYLFSQYHLLDLSEYKGLYGGNMAHTGAMRNFYIFMGRIISKVRHLRKQGGEEESYIISIDEMCEIFRVDFKQATERKRYVKKMLGNLKKELTKTIFEWEFVKNGGRFAYHVKFDIPTATLEYFNEQFKEQFFYKLFGDLQTLYINETGQNPLEIRRRWREEMKQAQKPERHKFTEWILDPDEHVEQKLEVAKRVYIDVYRTEYSGDPKDIFQSLS